MQDAVTTQLCHHMCNLPQRQRTGNQTSHLGSGVVALQHPIRQVGCGAHMPHAGLTAVQSKTEQSKTYGRLDDLTVALSTSSPRGICNAVRDLTTLVRTKKLSHREDSRNLLLSG